MNELDLEGVEPTSHVVDLTNVLREDVPRPGADARAGAGAGARRGRRRLPRPEPGGVVSDELLNLTAAQQAERIAAGELVGAARLFEFWRERAAGDDLELLPVGGRRGARGRRHACRRSP